MQKLNKLMLSWGLTPTIISIRCMTWFLIRLFNSYSILREIFIRSSHRRRSLKKVVLKNFATFTGKHLHWSLFLNKVRLQHRCFPVNIEKSLRTSILKNICERLLLDPLTIRKIALHEISLFFSRNKVSTFTYSAIKYWEIFRTLSNILDGDFLRR